MFLSGHRRHTLKGARDMRPRPSSKRTQLIGCQITPLIIPGHPIVNNPNDNKSNIRGQCARCSELTKVDNRNGLVVLP